MISRRDERTRAKVKDCLAALLKWLETGSMLYPAVGLDQIVVLTENHSHEDWVVM